MIGFLVATLLLGAAAPPECDAAADRAGELALAEDFSAALKLLDEAYACFPDPKYLFARSYVRIQLNDCDGAVEDLRDYLGTAPSAEAATVAREAIRGCGEDPDAVAPTPVAPVTPEPKEPQPEPRIVNGSEGVRHAPLEPDDAADSPRGETWQRDVTGGALLGVGLGTLTAGGALLIVGIRQRSRAPNADTQGMFESSATRSTALQATGIALSTVAGALVIGAITRYALVKRRVARPAAHRGQWLVNLGRF